MGYTKVGNKQHLACLKRWRECGEVSGTLDLTPGLLTITHRGGDAVWEMAQFLRKEQMSGAPGSPWEGSQCLSSLTIRKSHISCPSHCSSVRKFANTYISLMGWPAGTMSHRASACCSAYLDGPVWTTHAVNSPGHTSSPKQTVDEAAMSTSRAGVWMALSESS